MTADSVSASALTPSTQALHATAAHASGAPARPRCHGPRRRHLPRARDGSERDGQRVRDVERGGRQRRDRQEHGFADGDRDDDESEWSRDRQEDRDVRRPQSCTNAPHGCGCREATVARECVERARRARHRRQTAEPHREDHQRHRRRSGARPERVLEHERLDAAMLERSGQIADGEREASDDGEACDGAHTDRRHDSPGCAPLGMACLFARVRRRVEAGERPHSDDERLEEAERVAAVGARGARLREERERLRPPEADQRADEHDDADDVNCRGDAVQPRDEADRHDVRERVTGEDAREDDVRSLHRNAERRDRGLCARQIDRGHDRHLTDEVHHRREPTRARAAEERRPVIERTCGGERARELRHRQRDEHRSGADERPSEPEPRWPSAPQARRVRRKDSGEHADDRKAQREARESSHRAKELLRVAEPRERTRVVVVVAAQVFRSPVALRREGAFARDRTSPRR